MPVKRILHGVAYFSCTQRVLFTSYEVNVPVQGKFVDVLKSQEHKTKEFLELQPFGVVPVLDVVNEKNERQVKIYESRAICRYINRVGDGSLIPKDENAYGIFEQFAATEAETTTPILSKIIGQRVYAPARGQPADETIVQSSIEPLRTSLKVLNDQLTTTQNYIAGDFSLVDIYYVPYFNLLVKTPEWKIIEEYPEVVAWFKRVTSRPAWQKTLETKF